MRYDRFLETSQRTCDGGSQGEFCMMQMLCCFDDSTYLAATWHSTIHHSLVSQAHFHHGDSKQRRGSAITPTKTHHTATYSNNMPLVSKTTIPTQCFCIISLTPIWFSKLNKSVENFKTKLRDMGTSIFNTTLTIHHLPEHFILPLLCWWQQLSCEYMQKVWGCSAQWRKFASFEKEQDKVAKNTLWRWCVRNQHWCTKAISF